VFLGRGDVSPAERDAADEETTSETEDLYDHTPTIMFLPAVALLVGAMGVGVWFGIADLATTAAHAFVDVPGYHAAVFGGTHHAPAVESASPEWFDYLYCGGATVLAMVFAATDLWGTRMGRIGPRVVEAGRTVIAPIQRLHSGRVGDYTAALVLGVGLLSALMALTLS
jgi:multicomponent Na+:H+ antiporter subunit D